MLSIDPLAAKYPSLSPYSFVANSPIVMIDPDGNKLIPTNEAALQIIKYSVTPDEAKYIQLNQNGYIDINKLIQGNNELSEVSKNFRALIKIVSDDRVVEVHVEKDMKILDGNGTFKEGNEIPLSFKNPLSAKDDWLAFGGNEDLSGEIFFITKNVSYSDFIKNENDGMEYSPAGTRGVSLFPLGTKLTSFDAAQKNKSPLHEQKISTNKNFQVQLNMRLYGFDSNLTSGIVGVYSHEAYGHILSYFEGKNALHGTERTDRGNSGEYNKNLELKIKEFQNEAEKNYRMHNED